MASLTKFLILGHQVAKTENLKSTITPEVMASFIIGTVQYWTLKKWTEKILFFSKLANDNYLPAFRKSGEILFCRQSV
jgi:hypothetical protein